MTPGFPLRVVVVDDHPSMRRLARELLSARGYEVVGEADCASSAFDLIARVEPHAVLLDVGLGEDDGYDVCWALTDRYPDLKVVLNSADPQRSDASLLAEVGARGFVSKCRLAEADLGAWFT